MESLRLYTPFFLKDEPGKPLPRMIWNYSHKNSKGISLNSLVPDRLKSIQYKSMLDLVDFMDNDGLNNWAGKNDGEGFFRQIELEPSEQILAVYYWRGYKIVDTRMPWGTCMAPKAAQYLSEALEYIAYKYVPASLSPAYFSYVDDHIIRGRTYIESI